MASGTERNYAKKKYRMPVKINYKKIEMFPSKDRNLDQFELFSIIKNFTDKDGCFRT